MKKICLLLLLVGFTLPAFSGTREFMEKALNSWLTYSIHNVIDRWGFPSGENTFADRHIYTWSSSWQRYVPQNTSSTITPNYRTATVNSFTTGGYTVTYYCNKTFEVDANNNIISWNWEGNGCPAFYDRNTKLLVNPLNDPWEKARIERERIKQEKKIAKQEQKRLKKEAKKKKKEELTIEKETKVEIIK